MPDISEYDWTEDSEALSITLVQGLEDEAVLSQLRLRQISDKPLTFDAAWVELPWPIPNTLWSHAQVDHLDGWTVVIENNGIGGADPANREALSAAGRAVNVFWNVNGVTSFGYAVGGAILRYFDPSGVDSWEDEGEPLPEEVGLDFEDEDANPVAPAILLMQRLTGVTLDGDWVLNTARAIYLAEYA
jgi:Family of unknown function (DUF6461)